ncbi:MAG: DUF2812 domain-containing protein [Clostridia bacterium]|nr:DUF2812 domain-containing protein [Clostridia bacterium]
MQKVVKKWFWAWNDDKEEIFLEDMAAKGYRLVHVGLGKYTFVEAEPKKIKYQLDFKGISKMKDDEYLQIFEDAGWDCVQRFGGWYYFAREYDDETPDLSIFNDNKSRLEKYRRIILFLVITGFPLYYNVIILFPSLDRTEFVYPQFYFFFRIIATILIVLHSVVLLRIAYKIIKDRRSIRE